jgi:FtsZ-binding cell division protein ZapB
MTPEEWADAIYEATGWTVSKGMAQAIVTLMETQAKGEIVLLRAEVEWLRDERERLAKEVSKAQLDILSWMEKAQQPYAGANQTIAELQDALRAAILVMEMNGMSAGDFREVLKQSRRAQTQA